MPAEAAPTALPLVIRRAGPADAATLLGMIHALARHEGSERHVRTDLATLLADGFGRAPRLGALLAEVDGQPAGYVSYTIHYSIWAGAGYLAIDDLYVAPAHRGSGTGRRLMQAAADLCRREGLAYLRWTVELGNPRAIAFYERLGATLHAKGVCTWVPGA